MEEKRPKKILIVEDEQALAASLVTLFNAQGYLAVTAFDGLYGISLAHKEKVDLIILDLGLPAGGGFFVLENLRQSVDTSNIPVLVLTAKPEKELQEKAYRLGVAAYLHKPFDPKELLRQIKDILGQ